MQGIGLTKTIETTNFFNATMHDSSESKAVYVSVSTKSFLLSCAQIGAQPKMSVASDKFQTTRQFLLTGIEFRQATDFQDILNLLSHLDQEIKRASVQVESDEVLSHGAEIFNTQSEQLQNLNPEEMFQLSNTFAEGASEGSIPEEDGNHFANLFLHAAADAGHQGAQLKLHQMNHAQVSSLDNLISDLTQHSENGKVRLLDVFNTITESINKGTEQTQQERKDMENRRLTADTKKNAHMQVEIMKTRQAHKSPDNNKVLK